MSEELTCKFGCTEQVNFLRPVNVTMHLEDGTIAMCKCGEKATAYLSGLHACIYRCHKCMYGNDENE